MIINPKEQKLEELLVEGYQATREEGIKLTKEFEQLDIEGWDDFLAWRYLSGST